MRAIIESIPVDATPIKISLVMTLREAKDLLEATKQTQHYPMGKLTALLTKAVASTVQEITMIKEFES